MNEDQISKLSKIVEQKDEYSKPFFDNEGFARGLIQPLFSKFKDFADEFSETHKRVVTVKESSLVDYPLYITVTVENRRLTEFIFRILIEYDRVNVKIDHQSLDTEGKVIKDIWPKVISSKTIENYNGDYLIDAFIELYQLPK